MENRSNSNIWLLGRQGGPSLPDPVPCTPGSYPFFLGFHPFNFPLFLPLSTLLELTPSALSTSLFVHPSAPYSPRPSRCPPPQNNHEYPGDLWRHCGGLGKEILMPYPINQRAHQFNSIQSVPVSFGLWDTALKFLSPGPRSDVTDHLDISTGKKVLQFKVLDSRLRFNWAPELLHCFSYGWQRQKNIEVPTLTPKYNNFYKYINHK